jgi:hypothetical protein
LNKEEDGVGVNAISTVNQDGYLPVMLFNSNNGRLTVKVKDYLTCTPMTKHKIILITFPDDTPGEWPID